MVSGSQIRQFKKDYNNLFLDTESGSPIFTLKRIKHIKFMAVFWICIAIIILFNIIYIHYNLKIPSALISTLDSFSFLILLGFYFSRRKDWIIKNEVLSNKLKEFISKIQQSGLRISLDIASEEQAGEKIVSMIPSQKLSSTSYSYGSYSNSSRFIQKINKNFYYIQLSNGFKIESPPQTKEQEQYVKFLQSAKAIEDDLYEKINHYFTWAVYILLITIAYTIPLLIIFNALWVYVFFFIGIIVAVILIHIHSSKSKVYVRTLIVQNKLPLKKIKIGADSNPKSIYSKIHLRKAREKMQEKYDERTKNPLTGRKKVFSTLRGLLLTIGIFALAGLLIYGIILVMEQPLPF